MPNDFWTRMASGSGAQPFQFTPRKKPTGLEVLLAGLAGFGNAKATQGARRIDDTQQRNAQAREAAKTLATWRHQERLKAKEMEVRKQELASNESYRRESLKSNQDLRRETEQGRIEQRVADRDLRGSLGKLAANAGAGRREVAVMNTILDNARQDPDIKDFVTIRDAHGVAKQASGQGDSEGDIILMRMVAKMTDPTTGVREEEFRTFRGAQGSLSRLGVKLTTDMVGQGQLTPIGRARLKNTAEGIYQRKLKRHKQAKSFYQKQAKAAGLDPEGVIRDYTEEDAAGAQATDADRAYIKSLGIKP
jgi:hypothetical protein